MLERAEILEQARVVEVLQLRDADLDALHEERESKQRNQLRHDGEVGLQREQRMGRIELALGQPEDLRERLTRFALQLLRRPDDPRGDGEEALPLPVHPGGETVGVVPDGRCELIE